MRLHVPAALMSAMILLAAPSAHAQPAWVLSHQKVSNTAGGFPGILDDGDLFGDSVASLGELDGDGVSDLAVGTRNDDDGGPNRGAVWVLFLNTDGTVKSHQKISDTEGDFLDNADWFGISVASLGDLDGNGVDELGVGALFDDDGGTNTGAVWILFLDGVVTCPVDINGDGALNVLDFVAFQILWTEGDPGADCDGNGAFNVLDFVCFQGVFVEGCD
jgi:hypothetical protein